MDQYHDTQFHEIDRVSTREARRLIVDLLKEYRSQILQDRSRAPQIAYEIAGFMATAFVRGLDKEDPLDEIFIIAGELEVNPENADQLISELIRKIDELR